MNKVSNSLVVEYVLLIFIIMVFSWKFHSVLRPVESSYTLLP